MAVIKAAPTKASIDAIINYVTKDEKTTRKLLSGFNLSSPETAKDEMHCTKLLYGKTGGRAYKHFVQSFAPDENITPEQAHEIAIKFVEQCPQLQGFEVLIATHIDREHIHTHLVVNSVSFDDGHKFNMKSTELQSMKDLSDSICEERGLVITEKGKTFHGEYRKAITAYSEERYQILKKAEQGKVQSYVQDIAVAILECREQALNREDFVSLMSERGYAVKWEDNRKYITFTDLKRQEQGEKKCSVRNNKLEQYYHIEFSKEALEYDFVINEEKVCDELKKSAPPIPVITNPMNLRISKRNWRKLEPIVKGNGIEYSVTESARGVKVTFDKQDEEFWRKVVGQSNDEVSRKSVEEELAKKAKKAMLDSSPELKVAINNRVSRKAVEVARQLAEEKKRELAEHRKQTSTYTAPKKRR